MHVICLILQVVVIDGPNNDLPPMTVTNSWRGDFSAVQFRLHNAIKPGKYKFELLYTTPYGVQDRIRIEQNGYGSTNLW